MGLLGIILSLTGFFWGIVLGVTVGFFLFFYTQTTDVKDPEVKPISDLNVKDIKRLLPEIPQWVMAPDYDRVDWINRFLREMWPYLDKAVAKEVKAQVAPLIEKYKPAVVQSIDFDTLTLGTLPPTITGMKVYDTADKEVILEPVLKWAGNPNIVVAAKACGVKATVQVAELQVFATARVTLKPLVPVFPCFSKITVSLMSKPKVDFALKLVGGDVMAIPGLYQVVQSIIANTVADMLLWPRAMTVYDDAAAGKQQPKGMLEVTVVDAKEIRKADLLGSVDPYVTLALGADGHSKKKTSKKSNDQNPVWNESFKFVISDPETETLELSVFDWDKVGKDTLMGSGAVPLTELKPEVPNAIAVPMRKSKDLEDLGKAKNRGVVNLLVTYKPFKEDEMVMEGDGTQGSALDSTGSASRRMPDASQGGGLLTITIHDASDLDSKHAVNAYVKFRFLGEERKTKVVKKTTNPEWEESFEFTQHDAPMDEVVHFQVFNKHTGLSSAIAAKECLGTLDIKLSDVVTNRRINDVFQLNDCKSGKLAVELEWRSV